MSKIIRCHRCDRRYRGEDDWHAVFRAGVIVGVVCADCQIEDHEDESIGRSFHQGSKG